MLPNCVVSDRVKIMSLLWVVLYIVRLTVYSRI